MVGLPRTVRRVRFWRMVRVRLFRNKSFLTRVNVAQQVVSRTGPGINSQIWARYEEEKVSCPLRVFCFAWDAAIFEAAEGKVSVSKLALAAASVILKITSNSCWRNGMKSVLVLSHALLCKYLAYLPALCLYSLFTKKFRERAVRQRTGNAF